MPPEPWLSRRLRLPRQSPRFLPRREHWADTVTITGTNFSTTVGQDTVKFGGTTASITGTPTTTSLTATVPAGSNTVDVTVTTSGGRSAINEPGDLFAYAKPTVTAVNPAGGPTAGGTSVTLTGTNFVSGLDGQFWSQCRDIGDGCLLHVTHRRLARGSTGASTVTVTKFSRAVNHQRVVHVCRDSDRHVG